MYTYVSQHKHMIWNNVSHDYKSKYSQDAANQILG